jgi:tripartite-type tricarboxylate transporter receptor subunit TctC
MSTRASVTRFIAAAAAMAAVTAAHAQSSYPEKPVRLILPYTAGSPNDVLARLIAPDLSARLGQAVIVDNRPGGATAIGTRAVMTAEPDGYTLLFSNTPTLLIVPVAAKAISYDPLKDVTAIATVGSASNVMVISAALPAANLKEFIAYAKANPGKLNFGFGQGTQPHLVGEMFKRAAGLDIANVPYKGGAQAVTDLLGGRIHMNIGTLSTLRPLHLQGKVRAVAVTSTERSPLLPDVPTMAESGLPEVTSVTYYSILGPPGLRAEIVNKLNGAVNEILKSAELRAAMEKLGFAPHPSTPQEFAALVASENKKWVPVVKATGFQM